MCKHSNCDYLNSSQEDGYAVRYYSILFIYLCMAPLADSLLAHLALDSATEQAEPRLHAQKANLKDKTLIMSNQSKPHKKPY